MNDPTFSVSADTNIAQFPAELGSAHRTSAQIGVDQTSTGIATAESGKTDVLRNDIDKNGKYQSTNSLKTLTFPTFPQKNASSRQSDSCGYNYQTGGGMSQRNNAGNDWPMKQVYVAIQTTSGSSSAA
ncbi:uncharacterized protein Fot_21130 [Forsythia ovata]|uniref:Uncharacterized protein n=1 Tax=Forsythia ovata TaxID=205694 RepID=A0ABD1UU52_9LAMI